MRLRFGHLLCLCRFILYPFNALKGYLICQSIDLFLFSLFYAWFNKRPVRWCVIGLTFIIEGHLVSSVIKSMYNACLLLHHSFLSGILGLTASLLFILWSLRLWLWSEVRLILGVNHYWWDSALAKCAFIHHDTLHSLGHRPVKIRWFSLMVRALSFVIYFECWTSDWPRCKA